MNEQIKTVQQQIDAFAIENQEQLEQFRLQFISRKSLVADLFEAMKSVPSQDKKAFGQALNELKNLAQSKFDQYSETLQNTNSQKINPAFDLTLPVPANSLGTIHPISAVRQMIVQIFERIGFNVADGPEIEDDWHNFTALNFAENHPAREMQDTFFIEKNPDILLRTHTSNVQVRLMENQKPPIRSIMPGRVYRNEAISARAHCLFHQVEGLFVDTNVGFLDLKQTLYHFAKEMFGKDTKVRFRPSYFPFTEPSAEIDISCDIDNPKGCQLCGSSKNICKGTGWVEIGGSGMVDTNVLESCGIDSQIYTGFA
ncbi:MAG: phenylalanine--tRNA ligase subunit alpha, partial [Verrucomicrobia bacterium]|nr:phenylalanine--tRNA ligase subunit alpha [Cytophagales bacterium]